MKIFVQPTRSDNPIKLRQKVDEFRNSGVLDEITQERIASIISDIVDPVQESLVYLREKRYINEEEISTWESNARTKMEKTLEEALTLSRPKPEHATSNIRMKTPRIAEAEYSHEKISMNISEAINQAFKEAMRLNRNILVMGPDVYKGPSIRKEGDRIVKIEQGGYFNQTSGLFEEFGRDPHRIHNTAIAEEAVCKFASGMATTTTDPKALRNALRPVLDFQYADYGAEGLAAPHVLWHVFYTTDGKITRPVGVILPSGAVAGGGTMHSHEVSAKALQTPSCADVFYPSDPETTYKLLRYCLLHENNPYIFMVDKTNIFRKEEFEIGTGFFEPGRAKVRKEGNDIQCITIGPAANKTDASIAQLSNPYLRENTGNLDLVSLRPFPDEDVSNYLSSGIGPIVIIHEEPEFQGVGNQVISMLKKKNSPLFSVAKGRDVYHIASRDVPAPPCDGILMNEAIPTSEDIKNFIEELYKKS